MTALKEYQRLECTGLWRESAGSQRIEVIVSFGDATLVIADSRSTRALTHWSLPAVVRINPGQQPARYAPDEEAGEELEIDDEAMIAAIAKVHRLIEARRPHPGRLRGSLIGAFFALLAAIVVFWLPAALVRHTAIALPGAKRTEIGTAIRDELARVTGQHCQSPEGLDALARLGLRVLGTDTALYVVPDGVNRALALPGGIILLSRGFIEGSATPVEVAGEILSARLNADTFDPIIPALRYAGFWASVRLLTSGVLPASSIAGYGEKLISAAPEDVSSTALLARFAEAGIPSSPYAWMRDPSGEAVLALIEADPFRDRPAPAPVLSDIDWVALQGICQN